MLIAHAGLLCRVQGFGRRAPVAHLLVDVGHALRRPGQDAQLAQMAERLTDRVAIVRQNAIGVITVLALNCKIEDGTHSAGELYGANPAGGVNVFLGSELNRTVS